jgi:hypothetical protein
MKQSCLTNIQEYENVRISIQVVNNKVLIIPNLFTYENNNINYNKQFMYVHFLL